MNFAVRPDDHPVGLLGIGSGSGAAILLGLADPAMIALDRVDPIDLVHHRYPPQALLGLADPAMIALDRVDPIDLVHHRYPPEWVCALVVQVATVPDYRDRTNRDASIDGQYVTVGLCNPILRSRKSRLSPVLSSYTL